MYTLVQHSGWVVSGKWDFKNAVELRRCQGKNADAVREVGGLIFKTYTDASNAEYNENYPPDLTGMIPNIQGSFSIKEVEGQKIYIPKVM